MKELFVEALEELKKKQDLMLVTIMDCIGSAPRGAGARMWVAVDRTAGTIGGGMIENVAVKRARELIKEQCSGLHEYDLGVDEAASIGMVCGGKVLLSFYYLSCQNQDSKELLEQITKRFLKGQNTWLNITRDQTGRWRTEVETTGDRRDICFEEKNGSIYYSERLIKEECVYIFGGGHVALELSELLKRSDFEYTIFDDREEFADAGRFPGARKVICGDFQRISDWIDIGAEDYAVIMTRGHKFDLEVQAWALSHKPYYIGVMGSRRKIVYVTGKLIERGFKKQDIAKCHMPIGMDIKADTPAEIAVSIMAELIRVRAGKRE